MPAVESSTPLPPATTEPVAGQPHAVFRWGGQRFAIGIGGVQEVVARLELTPLPRAGRGWLGVANLRGEILPAVSPGAWFPGAEAPAPVFLILRTPLGKLALAAESFEQVAAVPTGALGPAPEGAPAFVTGCWSAQTALSESVICVNAEGLARNLQAHFTSSFSAVAAP